MNGFFQLCAAILFLLWDRGRMLRGAWRRREWRNVVMLGFWFSLCLLVALGAPIALVLAAWAAWEF